MFRNTSEVIKDQKNAINNTANSRGDFSRLKRRKRSVQITSLNAVFEQMDKTQKEEECMCVFELTSDWKRQVRLETALHRRNKKKSLTPKVKAVPSSIL